MHHRRVWTFPLALAAALARLPAAHAQATGPGGLPPDPASIVTFDVENDAVNGTDRNYSSGLRLNYVSPSTDVPAFAADMGHALWGDGRQRISLGISQSIFTPSNTQIDPPNRLDRPYAGVLTLNGALIQDTVNYRSVLGLDLGVTGPYAGGRLVQNGFHNIIGDTPNRGWSYQIHNEPLVQITSERTYRLPITTFAGLDVDGLPELTVGLGNERIYAQTGGLIRLGQGLDADFGPARIRPGLTGADAYTPTRPFSWYVFAGIDGQAVIHDITLDGNDFQSSAHVTRTPFLGEAEAGLAVMYYGVKLSYTQVVQSREFRNQPGGLFKFGVATLSTRF